LQDLTVWNGNNGVVYFYQSEFPYDVTSAYGDAGYVSYRVGSNVTHHQAFGVGAYTFFRDHFVSVKNGFKIDAPMQLNNDIQFTGVYTWWITGMGEILSTINGVGRPLSSPGTSYIKFFPTSISVFNKMSKNRFLTQSEYSNFLRWSSPIGHPTAPGSLTYKILCDSNPNTPLLTIPPGGGNSINIQNLPRGSCRRYWVVSENECGLTAFGQAQLQ
jgi:hypothetical protein